VPPSAAASCSWLRRSWFWPGLDGVESSRVEPGREVKQSVGGLLKRICATLGYDSPCILPPVSPSFCPRFFLVSGHTAAGRNGRPGGATSLHYLFCFIFHLLPVCHRTWLCGWRLRPGMMIDQVFIECRFAFLLLLIFV